MSDPIDERRGATSASNATADNLCQGRHLAQKGIPDKSSKDAAHGNLIHAALAGDAEALATMTVEQRDIYDACQKIEAREVEKAFGADWKQAKVWKEQRFWLRFQADVAENKLMLEHSAKPDKVYRLGNRALVIEYKTLTGDVPTAPNNLQGRDQVCLVSGHLLVHEVAFLVIQPLVTHTPEICVYVKEDIERALKEMVSRITASNTPGAPRLAGSPQCDFCKAKVNCVEYNKWAGGNVPMMLHLLDVPIANWTPEQRGEFCDLESVAREWLDNCKNEMKEGLANDPKFVAGWMLKPGNMIETITNPAGVFARFAELGGTEKQFLEAVSVVKTKLKEQLAALTHLKGKALDGSMSSLTEGYTHTKQNAPSLVKNKKEIAQ